MEDIIIYNIDYLTLKICFYEVDCKLSVETDFYSIIKFDSKEDTERVYNKLVNCKEFEVSNDCITNGTSLTITGDATVSYDSTSKLLMVLVMN
jgi:hypothetical protein|nr:MAG TPA: hypothetical protein [Crassvirales sp.]